jgi:hypothetical protein
VITAPMHVAVTGAAKLGARRCWEDYLALTRASRSQNAP